MEKQMIVSDIATSDRTGARAFLDIASFDGRVFFFTVTDARGLILQDVELPIRRNGDRV